MPIPAFYCERLRPPDAEVMEHVAAVVMEHVVVVFAASGSDPCWEREVAELLPEGDVRSAAAR